jgi:hypothetical protein
MEVHPRLVVYVALPLSGLGYDVQWRLIGDDVDLPNTRAVFMHVVNQYTQSSHGDAQILFAHVSRKRFIPHVVDNFSVAGLLELIGGTPVQVVPPHSGHRHASKGAGLAFTSRLRCLHLAAARLACPGHTGDSQSIPDGLTRASDSDHRCWTCVHYCPTRSTCKAFGDFPVTPDLVCLRFTPGLGDE